MTTLDELLHRPGPGSHRVTLTIGGRSVDTLADLPPERRGLLFVGLNPSPVSVEAGHYHQGALGRRFWSRLGRAGIVPADVPVESADDALVAAGHGITDLLKLPSPRDTASDAELTAGVGPLWQKIALWRPGAVVFIYKRAASISAGRDLEQSWGQLEGVAMGGRPCFLMPGPYATLEQVDEGLNLLRNLAKALADRPN
jgi:TDG/mug DNA glycosylase family protein